MNLLQLQLLIFLGNTLLTLKDQPLFLYIKITIFNFLTLYFTYFTLEDQLLFL